MDVLMQDLRYALRQLAGRPGFSLVAVLTLTLGIGATTAMFSLLRSTVLAALPYPEAERLVQVQETTPEGADFSASEPNFLDFRARSRALDRLVALKDRAATLSTADEPLRVDGLAVSHGYFELLGAQPTLGRDFLAEEDQPGSQSRVLVLSHTLWQQRFAGDPQILGRDIQLDGESYRVVGVAPAGFSWFGAQFWQPLAASPDTDRGDHWLSLIGRLAVGASIDQASEELNAVAGQIGREHPRIAGWGVRVASLRDWLIGSEYRYGIYLLFAAVTLLLGIACVNLANLLFVRTHASQAEIGLRTALGASRSRIARHWFTEVLLLSSLGVIGGVLLAQLAVSALLQIDPGGVPRLQQVEIDGGVLLFASLAGLLTALLFGLAPAWRAARVNAASSLQHGGRTGLPRGHRRLSDVLVVAQVALSALLLVGAGILLRSFVTLQSSDPGFNPDSLLAVSLQLSPTKYAEPWQKVVFFNQLDEGLQSLPGVVGAGATAIAPFSGNSMVNDVTPVERAAEVGPAGYLQLRWRAATPGFFRAAGLPLLQGRLFERRDPWNGPPNIVITASAAAQLWPGESALGKRLYWGSTDGEPRIVIGVVGDYQDVQLGDEAAPLMFLPYNQLPWPEMTVVVRTQGEISGMAASIRDQIHALDPDLPIPETRPLRGLIDASVAGPRLRTWLLSGFAAAALLLAAIGIYGVMAFNFACRRRELGLRLVVGAAPRAVLRMLLGSGIRLVLIGSVLGAAAAWALSRTLSSLIHRAAGVDPLAFIGALALLGVVALAAIYVPARRALRSAPIESLRDD